MLAPAHLLGGTSGGARQFIRQAEAARKDPQIKAVVIRINSPGGSASASQEMYEAVMRLRRRQTGDLLDGRRGWSGRLLYRRRVQQNLRQPRHDDRLHRRDYLELLNYQELFAENRPRIRRRSKAASSKTRAIPRAR